MSNTLKVRPAKGKQVRMEDGSLIPEKGGEVPNSSYYRRRLRDGDLESTERKARGNS